ncbi:hypothetical protein [Abyssicoccus albus]|uniref:hypothetical protein n=1 Tax=Abyssicoccus albus TaxID=1817405 RepID=UPI0039F102A5
MAVSKAKVKMKIKKVFKNKYTKKEYKLNDVVEVTENRFNEIYKTLGNEYVEKVD